MWCYSVVVITRDFDANLPETQVRTLVAPYGIKVMFLLKGFYCTCGAEKCLNACISAHIPFYFFRGFSQRTNLQAMKSNIRVDSSIFDIIVKTAATMTLHIFNTTLVCSA